MSVVETERLFLRYLDASDATSKYADWLNDPQVNQYLETRHTKHTKSTCRYFIEQCNNEDGAHLLGVFLKDAGQHIGNVKIGFINETYQRGELSLFIGDTSCWGSGYACELVSAVTRYGFEGLGLYKMEAGCYEENLASLKVFLRAGYTVEGFIRDHVVLRNRRMGCFRLGVLRHEYA